MSDGQDCMDQPPAGILDIDVDGWRCPCSGDAIRAVGDVEGGDLVYFCAAGCGWSWTP
jgi:hypothetical protein